MESIVVVKDVIVSHQLIEPIGKPKKKQQVLPCDELLWEAFKQGDEKAFMAIYEQYFELLCDFGVQIAPLGMVEDAVQDLFVHLGKKRAQLPKIKSSLKSFLLQSLKRRLFNMLKKNKGKSSSSNEGFFALESSAESQIILDENQKEQINKLDKAMASLSPKQREAIYYYFYQNMSYDEVKEILGYEQVKSARSYIYKVIKSLRENI